MSELNTDGLEEYQCDECNEVWYMRPMNLPRVWCPCCGKEDIIEDVEG